MGRARRVAVRAVGVEGDLGPGGQGDLAADVDGRAVDLGDAQGLDVDVGVVVEDARGGDGQDGVLVRRAAVVVGDRRVVDAGDVIVTVALLDETVPSDAL